MAKELTIGFIGAGNMGAALIAGLVKDRTLFSPDRILCSDPQKSTLKSLADKYEIVTTTDNRETIQTADILVLAIKPQVLPGVMNELAYRLDKNKLIISIVTGVTTEAIEKRAQRKLRIIKVMPNICATIGQGMSALTVGKHAAEGDMELAREIFECVGETVVVQEVHLDAITGLSGSGPAYIFMLIEALADAGVNMGLWRKDARMLATQTVLGAAAMVKELPDHPAALKDKVASPGGTTIAGLHAMAVAGVHGAMMNAVAAATERAKVLGERAEKAFLEES